MTRDEQDDVIEAATIARIAQSVGRVEGKIDAFISQMAVQDARATGIEVRMRSVEGNAALVSGAGPSLGVIAGMVGGHFIKM